MSNRDTRGFFGPPTATPPRYTIVYVESEYVFDEESYANLAALGIGWQTVIAALRHGKPRLTRWRGGLLQITAPDPAGDWVAVHLDAGDVGAESSFWVRHARYLEPGEVADVEKVLTMWKGREQR
jgi:hypothetical protein